MHCLPLQVTASKAKGKSGIRWHPLFIRWCLSIMLSGPKTYDIIRDTGFFSLPSRRTLRDYTNWTKTEIGYQVEAMSYLRKKVEKFQSFETYVQLVNVSS